MTFTVKPGIIGHLLRQMQGAYIILPVLVDHLLLHQLRKHLERAPPHSICMHSG